ncbi:MAG: LD-carboxypeptidase [Deltaproteobacteria bacterium]|nr:LD-carboxypeptidase [Deltaproteobacteria bacterium]
MTPTSTKLIIPLFLEPGDTIGIPAPASLYDQDLFEKGVQVLEGWGFKTRTGRRRIRKKRFLAGSDPERAEELTGMFLDPDIKAVICARGGYGTMRLLEGFNYQVIKKNPKLFVGFSDITALLAAFWEKTGLMTFHGPMVTTLSWTSPAFSDRLRSILLGGLPEMIPLPPKGKISGGRATGVLLGGNLTMLTHLLGTPFEPSWDGAILFVEDQGEEPYRLDRLLFHLRLAGVLDRISGLLLGQLSEKKILKPDWDLFRESFSGLDIPIWRDLPIGHGRENLTLPIGAPVELDGETGRLSFLW